MLAGFLDEVGTRGLKGRTYAMNTGGKMLFAVSQRLSQWPTSDASSCVLTWLNGDSSFSTHCLDRVERERERVLVALVFPLSVGRSSMHLSLARSFIPPFHPSRFGRGQGAEASWSLRRFRRRGSEWRVLCGLGRERGKEEGRSCPLSLPWTECAISFVFHGPTFLAPFNINKRESTCHRIMSSALD